MGVSVSGCTRVTVKLSRLPGVPTMAGANQAGSAIKCASAQTRMRTWREVGFQEAPQNRTADPRHRATPRRRQQERHKVPRQPRRQRRAAAAGRGGGRRECCVCNWPPGERFAVVHTTAVKQQAQELQGGLGGCGCCILSVYLGASGSNTTPPRPHSIREPASADACMHQLLP